MAEIKDREFGFERAGDCDRHKGTNVAAHRGYLADQCGGNRAHRRARGQEDCLQLRSHRLVHAGHLHLVVEIGAVTQATDHDGCAVLAGRVNHQTGEGDDTNALGLAAEFGGGSLFDQFGTLLKGEQWRLRRLDADGGVNRIRYRKRGLQHIEMAVGQRIERASIESDAFSHDAASSGHRAGTQMAGRTAA